MARSWRRGLAAVLTAAAAAGVLAAGHAAPPGKSQGLKDVTDYQGNRYQVDGQGAIYTDASPLRTGRHASVPALGFYFNKFGSLLGAGKTEQALLIGAEILDLPDAGSKDVLRIKGGVSASMSRLMSEAELNRSLPFAIHEEGDAAVYRNRLHQFEVRYPAALELFEFQPHIEELQRSMIGWTLRVPARPKEAAGNIILLTEKGAASADAFSKEWLGEFAGSADKAPARVPAPVRKDAREFTASYREKGQVIRQDFLFLHDAKSQTGYMLMFFSPSPDFDGLRGKFVSMAKSLRIGGIAPFRYVAIE